MTTQNRQKNNNSYRTIKQSAYIRYVLNLKNISFTDIAKFLGVTPQAVYQCVKGVSRSAKIENYLNEILEMEV